jgi:hypothetical protein
MLNVEVNESNGSNGSNESNESNGLNGSNGSNGSNESDGAAIAYSIMPLHFVFWVCIFFAVE